MEPNRWYHVYSVPDSGVDRDIRASLGIGGTEGFARSSRLIFRIGGKGQPLLGAGAYDAFIQTDASINPGNSGGPLLNTAIFSGHGGNIGIGFATPIDMAKELLPQLKEGRVVRGWLGIMVQVISPAIQEKLGLDTTEGALVSSVTEGGPADKAGIQRGDVIISFNGKDIKEMQDLPHLVATTEVGKTVPAEIIRDGDKDTIQVTIEEMYPSYMEVVKLQEENGAYRSFEWSYRTEKKHKAMFEKAKEAVTDKEDVELGPVQVCEVCGYTLEGDPPDRCPVCGAEQEKFSSFL